jgi:hypothetical protein
MQQAPRVDWKAILSRGAPVLALGLGVLSQAFARHTVSFAPKAVALLVVAWTMAALGGAVLPAERPGEPHGRWRHLLRRAAATATVGLFRNVLFFLVPVWFASATLDSVNLLPVLALGAVALLSCFPGPFREHVLERPRARTLWCSAVLFAALVPAAAVETAASPRLSAAVAAAAAWVASTLVTSRSVLASARGRSELVASAVLAAVLCAAFAPLLPPVPVACSAKATGTALRNHEIEGAAKSFPAGTKRVYAWFAVHLPPRYRQGLRFEWFRDGRLAGHVVSREAVGGREQGFRTASFTAAPGPGSWRVDLSTDGGQLIARQRFVVESP